VPLGIILHREYDRLAALLRGLSLRLQLLSALEFLILLASAFILVLLGSIIALELEETFAYLAFIYCLLAIVSLFFILLLGLRRVAVRPSAERVAKGLEEKFPNLKDDVTNSLLLFRQIQSSDLSQISEALVAAQIRRTVSEVGAIQPGQVVDFRKALRHLRILLPLILAFLAVLSFDPHFLNRSLALITHPLSTLPARETFISVAPVRSIVLRGTRVIIRAQARGNIPDTLVLAVWPEGREAIHLKMDSEGEGRFSYQMASAQFSFRYQAYNGRAASPVYSIRVVDPPDVGKLKLTLIPPDYTGLRKEVRQGGHIEALKGTVANLEAQATKAVTEGKIVLDQGNELLLGVKEDRLKGSLLIFSPGSYSIKVKDEMGFENPNPVHYQVRLIPDKYPEAEIISPAQDLEVSGNETIPIVYTARDDFGLTGVRLNYQMAGRERFINLKAPNGARFLGVEIFKWDLATLTLAAADRVAYRLEVVDNDSVSGPKVSYSQTFYLSVKDARARAAKEGEEAQQIADALLDLLGDQLEAARDKESLAKSMEEILKKVDKNLERMEKNRAERFDLEALRRNLASLHERMPAEPKETVTQEMERLALLAEDIAKKARMNEVEALAREIRNRQRRLTDSLKEFKGSMSQKDLDAIMKELKDLEKLIRSVMEALSKLASRLPDEFVNSPDLKGLDFQDLFKDLEEIQKRLMAGDVSGAQEVAQRLLQALSEMMASLQRAGAQAGMAPYNRLQGEMSRQTGELDRILAEQKEILSETEKIDRETKRIVDGEIEKRLKYSLPQLQEALEELARSLPPEQKEAADELQRLLKEGRLERFSQLSKELEKELSGRPGDQKIISDLRARIEGLSPDPRAVIGPEDREKFPGLSSRQDNLKERTMALGEKLDLLSQLFPGMDTEIMRDLKEATGSMGEASGKLKGEDAPGAIPPEQEVIRRLTKSQQAMKQMAQQMAMQRYVAQWGPHLVYDPRPAWYYGPWVPMPTLPQPEVNRPRERGYTGLDREEFEPPSKDAYRVPKIFRDKVLEGLKEEAPSQYKRRVERYFKGLSE
jgi:ribosome-associated translation inhibitor RaiA/soluble cytochrome b562